MVQKQLYKELGKKIKKLEEENLILKQAVMEQKLYKQIFKESNDYLALLDRDYRYQLVNDTYVRNIGKKYEDILGHTVPELFGNEFFEQNQKPMIDRCLKGEIVRYQRLVDFQNLGKRFVDITHTPYLDESGIISGYIVNGRDITDIKSTEEALRVSEKRHRLLAENTVDIVWQMNLDLEFTYINQSILPLLGYTPEEFIGSKLSEHSPLDELEKIQSIFSSVLEETPNRMNAIFETIFFHKNGKEVPCEISGKLILDDEGKPIYIQGNTRNITERKFAEDALRESEENYRSMMEAMEDSAYICSPDFRVDYMNPAMIKRIGYEAIGELCHKVMYGIDEKCSWCVHESVMKGEHVKTEIINPLDSKTYNISNSPIFHTDGSISKLTIYRDITAHRQVEEDYQMLFHKMLNGFALCEIICDTAGNPIDFRYLATNPAFENITGLKSEDIVGKTLLEIAPDTEHYWIEIFGKVALTGEPIFFENYTNVLGKHLELNTFRPGPNQFATVFADITDKKKWKTSFNNPRRWNP